MGEISCKAVHQLLDGFEHLGLDADRVVREASFDRDRLRDPDGVIDWDEFVDLHEAAERLGLQPVDFEAIGEAMPRLPSVGSVARIARFVVTPRQLYEVSFRWIAPNLFPFLRVRRAARSKDVIELELEIPGERRGCEAFLRVNLGVVRVVPTLLGYPRAHVDAEVGSHAARFRIRLPHRTGLGQRLRLHAKALLSPGSIIRELGRQQAEVGERFEALMRARQDFRQVIEGIPDLVLICRSGTVIYANPASSRVLGWSEAQRCAQPQFLDLVHGDDRAAALRHLAARKGSSTTAPTELRFVTGSGEEVLLELAPARPVHFEDRPALLLVARDLTESHRLRNQLERADRLSSLGSLVATVGHELSNPLGYIALNLGLLERLLGQEKHLANRARIVEAVRSARQGTARAREILRELTTFSRGTETPETIEIRAAIEAAIELAGKEVEQHARLATDYQVTPAVRANRGRLEQVIVNLLLNASQSFPDQPPAECRVTVRTRTGPNGDAWIDVEDNGMGMDEVTCAQIFDPFFSTKPAGEGTGLGLAICRDIVEEAGGEICVESTPGGGARFSVRLPAASAAHDTAASAGEPDSEHEATVRARVLIIDDEPNLTEVLRELLMVQHDVVAVASAEQALALFETDRAFDIILCDIKMTGMSGIELYEQLHETEPLLAQRVTFMTGGAFGEQTSRFLAAVPNRFIEKPFDLDLVLSIVDAARGRGTEHAPG